MTIPYEQYALDQAQRWREQMLRQPGMFAWMSRRLQSKVNAYIPEKVHASITAVVKQMTQAVIEGSQFVAPPPLTNVTLEERERIALEKIDAYTKTAAVEGGVTGAGGILLGLADFPLWFSIKLKMLHDLAAVYGHSCTNYGERVFLLGIFQLAFSSQEHRRNVFAELERWCADERSLPTSMDDFDWRTYQQEYRNYIDLAKLAQLIPVVGAPVGIVVNYSLTRQLGDTAMNAYRLRWFSAAQRHK